MSKRVNDMRRSVNDVVESMDATFDGLIDNLTPADDDPSDDSGMDVLRLKLVRSALLKSRDALFLHVSQAESMFSDYGCSDFDSVG